MCTTYTGVSIRHSDWTRYRKTPRAARLGIWIACPLVVAVSAIFGILVTSACRALYGEILWQPMTLLGHIQTTDYSATTRAGTFFAGLGWFLSQVAINYSSNAIATGMDLASILPEYLNARRGSFLLAIIAIAICPWNMVNNPGTFITVIGSLGIFISPLIGIYIADYFLVRKMVYKVPDLYIGKKSSIYWFQFGFHWRSFLTWLLLIWMSLRKLLSGNRGENVLTLCLAGFVGAIRGQPANQSWTRIFQISFLIGKYSLRVLMALYSTVADEEMM